MLPFSSVSFLVKNIYMYMLVVKKLKVLKIKIKSNALYTPCILCPICCKTLKIKALKM
jgi:hypothetical protein